MSTQKYIQEKANALRENDKTMTFAGLREDLHEVGYEYVTEWGVANGAIKSAYVNAEDRETKDNVAKAFTGKDGRYAWDK